MLGRIASNLFDFLCGTRPYDGRWRPILSWCMHCLSMIKCVVFVDDPGDGGHRLISVGYQWTQSWTMLRHCYNLKVKIRVLIFLFAEMPFERNCKLCL